MIGRLVQELHGKYVKINAEDLGVIDGSGKPRQATAEELADPAIPKIVVDPWGESYIARENESREKKRTWMRNRNGMDIYSKGPNRRDDTLGEAKGPEDDDIGNW